ncbi:MAG TPA: hypothetical protein VH186_00210 [Chloroflexia bacterium]|nr:hypothetical protein [Chloroflexia bacterium]
MQRKHPSLKRSITLVAIALILALSSLAISLPPGSPARAEDCQTFKETGFTVCGNFLAYWQNHGGLARQGFPISPVFDEQNPPPPAGDGKVHRVQYFQRARFEEHPENQPPYEVLSGLLGSENYLAKYGKTTAQVPVHFAGGSCRFFVETGFALCGSFQEYWNAHGGLAQQGFPISDSFLEQNPPPPAGDGQKHIVQYFQRARLELHDENTVLYDVLPGLVGVEQFRAKYPNGAPGGGVVTPAPSPAPTPATNSSASCSTSQPPVTANLSIDASLIYLNASEGVQTLCVAVNKNGQPVVGAKISFVVHYKDKDQNFTVPDTGTSGFSKFVWDIGKQPKGFTINVDVTVTSNGETATARISWTPQ